MIIHPGLLVPPGRGVRVQAPVRSTAAVVSTGDGSCSAVTNIVELSQHQSDFAELEPTTLS